MQFLNNIKVLNKRLINPLRINGWISNINALKLLWDILRNNYNFKFLFTRRLTQDCVENLFSIIRLKCGNNVTPDSVKFAILDQLWLINCFNHQLTVTVR